MKTFVSTVLMTLLTLTSIARAKTYNMTEPQSTTLSSLSFRFAEIRTAPGDEIRFVIPPALHTQKLSLVILGHRQDPSTHKGGTPGQKQDQIPGLSAVLVHSTNITDAKAPDAWRYWAGMASGNFGAKFAEPRFDPEIENLYEWNSIGSRGVQSNEISLTPLLIDQVIVRNVGQDEVLVSQLTLKFIPQDISTQQTMIYSPGTEFSSEFGGKAHLGGGQSYQGTFPHALVLTSIQEIPLQEGLIIQGIEAAIGDSHPDRIANSDGGWGTQGWAKFSIGIGTDSSNIQWLTERENVPPEGLALAFPTSEIRTHGTKLYLKSDSDTTYVMGVRISYKK
jgi:hypothetical protein